MLRFFCLALCIQIVLPCVSSAAEARDRKWLVGYVSRSVMQDASGDIHRAAPMRLKRLEGQP